MRLLFVFVFLLGLVSCGWTDANKKAFLDGCNEDKKTTRLCRCLLDKLIENNISPYEADNLTDKEIRDLARECGVKYTDSINKLDR